MSSTNLLFQSEHHPLVRDTHSSLEEYCLSLIHTKAYAVAAQIAAGRHVLDLGCNHGYGTRLISERAASVVGVDVSKSAIDSAKERHPELRFELVDGQVLPFESASFDVVTTFQVIEHVEEPANYLNEIRRVLRSDGTAIFTTPNRELRLDPGMKPWNPFHVREYAAEELKQVLKGHFSDVEVRGLFATRALYDVECRRSLDARRSARGGGRWWQDPALTKVRTRQALRKRFDRMFGSKRTEQQPFSRFDLTDLFYREDKLNRALDFMAICRP